MIFTVFYCCTKYTVIWFPTFAEIDMILSNKTWKSIFFSIFPFSWQVSCTNPTIGWLYAFPRRPSYSGACGVSGIFFGEVRVTSDAPSQDCSQECPWWTCSSSPVSIRCGCWFARLVFWQPCCFNALFRLPEPQVDRAWGLLIFVLRVAWERLSLLPRCPVLRAWAACWQYRVVCLPSSVRRSW